MGDPTRRRMLDLLLAQGGGTATGLSAQLPVTRQAVAKHLVVRLRRIKDLAEAIEEKAGQQAPDPGDK